MNLTLGNLRVLSIKGVIPWRGVWFADVELDLSVGVSIPTGAVVLNAGELAMKATVDPRGSGSFVTRAFVRIVGGAGGWDKAVAAKQFNQPNGQLSSSTVYADTASAVGESIVDAAPLVYGSDFVRTAGPASRVFLDRDWYVDLITGQTSVGAWPAAELSKKAVVQDYDVTQQRVSLTSDVMVHPGTVFTDSRFNGATVIARDVEFEFTPEGSSFHVWCAPTATSRLRDALANMVREFAPTAYLKTYLYRFVLDVGDQLALQAISPGAPDLNPIAQWAGLSGAADKLAPSTVIVVGFAGGDASTPYVVSYSPLATPLSIALDASTHIDLTSLVVNIAGVGSQSVLSGGAFPLVVAPWAAGVGAAMVALAPAMLAGASSLSAAFTTLAAASTGVLAPLQPGFAAAATAATALGTANSALAAAFAGLPPPATILTKAT